ncbi:MAG TPA: RNA polymerase sigma factor [Azospirillum sp.]
MPTEQVTVPATARATVKRPIGFDFDRDIVRGVPELERYARRLTRNASEAEDLVQDCVERALRNRDKFEPGTNLQAWLSTILKNLHYTRCSRERRITRTEVTEDTITSPPAQDWQVMLREVGQSLEQLTPNHRRLIRMVAFDGTSYQEAAAALRVSIGTVRSRLSRARTELRASHAGTSAATQHRSAGARPAAGGVGNGARRAAA